MKTPQTPNFVKSHRIHRYKHPLCKYPKKNESSTKTENESSSRNKDTQNHSYIEQKHINLLLQTPTELYTLHSSVDKCYSRKI